jgi:hypothetical protein
MVDFFPILSTDSNSGITVLVEGVGKSEGHLKVYTFPWASHGSWGRNSSSKFRVWEICIAIFALPLPGYVALDNLLYILTFISLICEVQITIIPLQRNLW